MWARQEERIMDYKGALKKLEALRQEIEKGHTDSTNLDHAEVVILYGECEPIITQILGEQEIIVKPFVVNWTCPSVIPY